MSVKSLLTYVEQTKRVSNNYVFRILSPLRALFGRQEGHPFCKKIAGATVFTGCKCYLRSRKKFLHHGASLDFGLKP